MKQIVQIENLFKTYSVGNQEYPILRGINFSMYEGDFVSIMGSSGAGKSTLLNLVGAIDRWDYGSIWMDGIDLKKIILNGKSHLYRRDKIGFVFQNHYLMNDFTILENVMMPMLLQKSGKSKAKEKALAVLDKVGLSQRAGFFPSQISGGESQRVAFARSFVHNPPLILADEPTGNLDSENTQKFIDLIANLQFEENLTILLVTHDHRLAQKAQIQYYMEDGSLKEKSE